MRRADNVVESKNCESIYSPFFQAVERLKLFRARIYFGLRRMFAVPIEESNLNLKEFLTE